MKKQFPVALAVAAIFVSAGHAFAAEADPAALKCAPPVIQVAQGERTTAQYSIECSGASEATVTPVLTFSGEIAATGTPPYLVKAAYRIDTRGMHARALGQPAAVDQTAGGLLVTSTGSLAALPAQFAAQTRWDAYSNVISIEERPGQWRAFSLSAAGQIDGSVVDAGVASRPVAQGRTFTRVVFGTEFSRFAGKGADTAAVDAQLGLRDGRFEVLMGDSRAAATAGVQGALAQLDKNPKDITRAWALAARAQFLGMTDEVLYAKQKVAAHNPNLLEEFDISVQRIKPYWLP